jgi:hypothetical protein
LLFWLKCTIVVGECVLTGRIQPEKKEEFGYEEIQKTDGFYSRIDERCYGDSLWQQ